MIGDFKRFDMSRRPKRQLRALMPVIWLLSFPKAWLHRSKVDKSGLPEGVKPPYFLLCNHNSFMDFMIMTKAVFPHRANYVVAIDGFIGMEWLLRAVGGIGNRKFVRSATLVKNMLFARNQGDIVALFPEARYSLCGTSAVLPESLGKMVRLMNVPVVTLVMHGHHVNSPFWHVGSRGVKPVEAEMKLLLTQEQTQSVPVEKINKWLRDALTYDDFAWQKRKGIQVKKRGRAEGLHKVLYQCPAWLERKLWDTRYESHAIVEDGRMLSNICLYKTDMLVSGKPIRVHQLGGVATRKEARGQGLSRALMEHVLGLSPNIPVFLGANPSVLEFYPRFGFRPVQLHRPELETAVDNAVTPVRLSPDDPRVSRMLKANALRSGVLESLNTQPVQMFHLLLDYPDDIYYLRESDALVVASAKQERLFIAGVMAERPTAFEQIRKELPFSGIRRVEFGFCPDGLGVSPQWVPMDGEAEPYFVRGDWSLPEHFRFPALSET